MIGSIVEKGNLTSSTLPVIQPATVTVRLTRLLLCSGRYSNVFTAPVRRSLARTPTVPPVSAPVVPMSAAAPVPARKLDVPATPIDVKPAASPAPMTGARNPALRPMTRPPPTVQRPMTISLRLRIAFLRASRWSSSFQFSLSACSCISSASVTRFSKRQISCHGTDNASPTRSNSTLDRAS